MPNFKVTVHGTDHAMSVNGPNAKCRDVCYPVAIGGKAEV
jgi:hypothetical protein